MKFKTTTLTIRIAPETKEKLQALATAKSKTMANYIAYFVEREYEKHEENAPKK